MPLDHSDVELARLAWCAADAVEKPVKLAFGVPRLWEKIAVADAAFQVPSYDFAKHLQVGVERWLNQPDFLVYRSLQPSDYIEGKDDLSVPDRSEVEDRVRRRFLTRQRAQDRDDQILGKDSEAVARIIISNDTVALDVER